MSIIGSIAAQQAFSLAGSAAAGGAGSAAGASLAASSALGPVGVALAAGGLALSIYQGLQQRKALKRQYAAIANAANENLSNLNDQITQVRRSYFDTTDISSQNFRQNFGALVNSLGATSGPSTTAVLAAQVANAAVDQEARRTALSDTITSINTEKKNVKAQAEAGLASARANYVPVGIQAIQGAVSGYQAGTSIDNLISSVQQSSALNSAYQKLLPAAQFGDSNALAQLQAIQSGVRPDLVLGQYGSVYTAPFVAQQQINGIQLETAQSDLFYSQLRAQAAQRQLGNSLQSLTNSDKVLRLLNGQ